MRGVKPRIFILLTLKLRRMAKYMKKAHTNRGASYFMILCIILFLTVLLRFFYIQVIGVIQGVNLRELAKQQHNKNGVLEASRGTIYDQNGLVLAQDTTLYRITVTLKGENKVKNKEKTAEELSEILQMNKEDMLNYLSKNRTQVELGTKGRNLSEETKKQIKDLKIPGITFIPEKARVYPHQDFASYVLGFTQTDEEGQVNGKFGLEKNLNQYLQSTKGKVSYLGANNGVPIEGKKKKVKRPKNGDNVYLTIDKKIQDFLEDAMSKAEKQYNPSMLIGIIADPKTGKILAMSSKPSFNPNKRDIEYFLNDPIANAFEPGSTMKAFTLAAAINEGVYNGSDYFQSGRYKVGSTEIKDHNNGYGWGAITFDEGFERSSNVAIAIIEDQLLKPDNFKGYITKFGLDQKTGIDLPGESKNKILLDTKLQQITTAFGQGSTVTPIQLVQASTAIANDGKMMKPYIIERIVDPEKNKAIVEKQPQEAGNPITKKTATKVRELLERVVNSPKGTGNMYKIDGYSIGGKTGTAQIPNPENGRYMEGSENYIFSFLGMAPIDNPELVIYLAIKQPKLNDGEYGAQPVADIFKSVMKNSLNYLKINPYTKEEAKEWGKQNEIEVQDFISRPMSTIKSNLVEKKLNPVLLGEGNIIKQYPQKGSIVTEGDRIFLIGNNIKMPDITGWSMRDVTSLSTILNLKLQTSGSGYASTQSIEHGKALKEGDTIGIAFEPPLEPLLEAEDPLKNKKENED